MLKQYDLSKKAERLDFCCEVAGEGIVMLRNNHNILPLDKQKLAVFGATQLDAQAANEGVKVDVENSVGLTSAMIRRGFEVDEELYETYATWRKTLVRRVYGEWRNMHVIPEMDISLEQVQAAKNRGAKTAVIALRRVSCENSDMDIEIGDYILSETEINMIRNVCAVFDRVVLLLQIGCSIDFGFLDDYPIDGILYLNHLGVNGALSVADIMCGNINPSGKLPVSLAKHYDDYPSSANFGQHGGGLLQDYREDIYVGYRYFETFPNADRNLLFPFGFGLSYTVFSVTDPTFKEKDGLVTVTAKVKNIGLAAGKEVLQLYYSCPQEGALLSGPQKQLCGFEKTDLLAPGESQTLTVTVRMEDLASYDDIGVLGTPSVRILEKGEHRFLLGTDSHCTEWVGSFMQAKNHIVERCHTIRTTLPERLKRDGTYEKLPVAPSETQQYYGISAIGETLLPVGVCSNHSCKDFSACQKGESYNYHLLPGTSGGYRIGFLGEQTLTDIDVNFDLFVDDVKICNLNEKEGMAQLSLPLERCILTLVPKKDSIPVHTMVFQKIDAKTVIRPDGLNKVDAASVYECDFKVTVKNYEDDGFGNSGSYITDFEFAGKFATYKLEVEQEGTYEIQFKYATPEEDRPMNTVMTVLASNIVQPLGGNLLKKTYNKGENRIFVYSDIFRISLPTGTVYLKLAAECDSFPDISEILLTKTGGEVTEKDIALDQIRSRNQAYVGIPRRKLIDDPSNYPKIGIQFKDVYKDPSLMRPFLEQMSNRELATIVSGTTNNLTVGGDVGCNCPIHERGIPAAQTADGPCGLRQFDQLPLALPVTAVLSATFNKELFETYGECMAEECLFYGVDYLLGPAVNIFRNPAGGRNCAYFSEDPYLAGIATIYYVKGVQSHGVSTVVKHYAANNSEFERLKSNSRVSGRALREIYMKAFEMACRAEQPTWAIMSSYNHINDVKVCEDYTLITEIPHEEWGWDGVFFTDWWNDSKHVNEVKAGHDLKMSTGDIEGVTRALDSGELTREQAMVCAERIVKMLMKLGRIKKQLENS